MLLADDLHNVLYRVDDRVGEHRAQRHLAVGVTLRHLDVPAIRPAGNHPVVATAHGASVTVWELEDLVDTAASAEVVGHLARSLHDATLRAITDGTIDPGVAPFDPLGAITEQLDAAAAVNAATGVDAARDDLAVLRTQVTDLRVRLGGADPQPAGIVHGDLHVDNVLVTRRGPVLADLELAGVGPVAYDLVAPVVAVERYGADPATLGDYFRAYGAGLPDASRHGPLRDTYELWLTSWAVANRHLDDNHEAEAQRRMQRWTNPGSPPALWTLR